MVDSKARSIQLSVGGRDFDIAQSPGVLQSNRAGGTTGAAVWQASVLFAEWLAWPQNPLHSSCLGPESSVLELGAGISGIVALMLHSRVRRFVATDQRYLLKALQENIQNNVAAAGTRRQTRQSRQPGIEETNISVLPLDWEEDDSASFLKTHGLENGVDVIVVCDCIFNYALIDPLVQTCADICRFREASRAGDSGQQPLTACVVCQQLRQPDVFSQWLTTFRRVFRVWRVPDEMLTDSLKEGSGFVVHLGILQR